MLLSAAISKGCYQSQNYKIWKQFTTYGFSIVVGRWLLSIIKLQNLKVIHNRLATLTPHRRVVINHKTTKIESNSQLSCMACSCRQCCYQSQNYKIWKEFTTSEVSKSLQLMLLSITKSQNLKAIYNTLSYLRKSNNVVINHKITKFESNSQLPAL